MDVVRSCLILASLSPCISTRVTNPLGFWLVRSVVTLQNHIHLFLVTSKPSWCLDSGAHWRGCSTSGPSHTVQANRKHKQFGTIHSVTKYSLLCQIDQLYTTRSIYKWNIVTANLSFWEPDSQKVDTPFHHPLQVGRTSKRDFHSA